MKRTMKICRRRPWARRATAIVEMAIVLPILVLLLFGIIEFGHAFLVRHNMISAAAQGARFGIRPGATEAMVIQKVHEILTETGVGQYPIGIEAVLTPEPDVSATVKVSVPFNQVAIFTGFVSDSVVLSSKCTNFR